MIKYLLGVLAYMSILSVNAQTDSTKINHYYSLQANQLVRQLFNFGGSTPSIVNPYLFTYAFNNQNGWGLSTGLGWEVRTFDDSGQSDSRESNISDISFRVGLDKKTFLTRHWLVGFGVDMIVENVKNETTNRSENDDQDFFQETYTLTKNSGIGFGPRLNFGYMFNERFMLGTEASYYFKSIKGTQLIETDFRSGNDRNFESEEFETTSKTFKLVLPSVLYITFRF